VFLISAMLSGQAGVMAASVGQIEGFWSRETLPHFVRWVQASVATHTGPVNACARDHRRDHGRGEGITSRACAR